MAVYKTKDAARDTGVSEGNVREVWHFARDDSGRGNSGYGSSDFGGSRKAEAEESLQQHYESNGFTNPGGGVRYTKD